MLRLRDTCKKPGAHRNRFPFVVYTYEVYTVQDGTSAVSASNVLYCTIVLKYNITKEKQQIYVVELIPKVAPAHS